MAKQWHLLGYEEIDVTHKEESSQACEDGRAVSDVVGMMGTFEAAEVGGASGDVDTIAVHIEEHIEEWGRPYGDGSILDNMAAASYSAALENMTYHVASVVEV